MLHTSQLHVWPTVDRVCAAWGIDSDNQEEGVTSEMGFQDSKKKEKNNIY